MHTREYVNSTAFLGSWQRPLIFMHARWPFFVASEEVKYSQQDFFFLHNKENFLVDGGGDHS